MRTMLFALGIAALAAGLSPGAHGLEVALRFEKNPNLEMTVTGPFFPFGRGNTELAQSMPSEKVKLPVFNSEKPLSGTINLGGRDHVLVLDGKRAGDKSYSRLWIDRDGDGDLTDEQPVDGKIRPDSNSFEVEFPGIEMTVGSGSIRLPYCIRPIVYGYVSNQRIQAYVSYLVSCTYTGTFTLGGKTCTIWLSDRNGNGMFNDRLEVQAVQNSFSRQPVSPRGDVVYLSDGKTPDIYQSMSLGDLLVLQNRVFEVGIDIPKGKLTLTEVKTGLTPVKLAMKTDRIVLYGMNGGKSVMIHAPSGETVPLPAGSYRLLSYQVYRRDEQGDLWRLTAGGAGDSPLIEVRAGGAAEVVFGEPFLTTAGKPGAELAGTGRGNVPLIFQVEGRGGELLTDLAHLEGTATAIPLSNGRKDRPKEPSYTIVKGDGEIVARGSFEYG